MPCQNPTKQILKYYLPTQDEESQNSETNIFNWQYPGKNFHVKSKFKGKFECVYFNANATFKLELLKDNKTIYRIYDVCIDDIKVEDENCVDASDKTTEYGLLYCLDEEPCNDRLYYRQIKKRIYKALKCFIENNISGTRNNQCDQPTFGDTTVTITLENTPKQEGCITVITPNFTTLSVCLILEQKHKSCKPCKPHKPVHFNKLFIIALLLVLLLCNKKIKILELLKCGNILDLLKFDKLLNLFKIKKSSHRTIALIEPEQDTAEVIEEQDTEEDIEEQDTEEDIEEQDTEEDIEEQDEEKKNDKKEE
jgi:hypothetical protein